MSNNPPLLTIQLSALGLRISDAENLLASSPSYALIEADRIQVGAIAEQQAHLRPREICTEFWQDLSGTSSTKHAVSHAEIAYKHLEAIWLEVGKSDARVIFICPANSDKNQLGLLLGICKKLEININSIVCNVALATQQKNDADTSVYLDLLQEVIVVTELSQSNSELNLNLPSRKLSFGLQDFIHNNAKNIAHKFISETRFDPLHSATYEQQFYDSLKLWLNDLKNNGTAECELSVDNKKHIVRINTDDITFANHHLFSEIANYLNVLFHQHNKLVIYCSASLRRAFGLFAFLSEMPGCVAVQLNDSDLEKHALSTTELSSPLESIHFITTLSWQHSSINKYSYNNGSLSNIVNTPTHLLISAHAYPLDRDLFLSLSENAPDKKLIVNYELEDNSLCKISRSANDIRLEVFKQSLISLNTTEVGPVSSLKINDILSITGTDELGQLIKVVRDEA